MSSSDRNWYLWLEGQAIQAKEEAARRARCPKRLATEEVERGNALAQIIRKKGLEGESAFDVDGETTVDLPTQAIAGRAGMRGKTFSGCIDLETGQIRIDCAEEPSFWMQVDLSRVPEFALAPGGPGVASVHEHFEASKSRLSGEEVSAADSHKRVHGLLHT